MNPDFHEFWDQLEQVLQVLLVNIVIVLFDNLIGLKIRENSVDGFGEPDRSKQITKTSSAHIAFILRDLKNLLQLRILGKDPTSRMLAKIKSKQTEDFLNFLIS